MILPGFVGADFPTDSVQNSSVDSVFWKTKSFVEIVLQVPNRSSIVVLRLGQINKVLSIIINLKRDVGQPDVRNFDPRTLATYLSIVGVVSVQAEGGVRREGLNPHLHGPLVGGHARIQEEPGDRPT